MTNRELIQPEPQCRDDGRCQYAIDHGAEGLGHCPKGKCCMPKAQHEPNPVAWMWEVNSGAGFTSRGIDFYPTNIPFAKHTALYPAPPRREFIKLTDEEIYLYTNHIDRSENGWAIKFSRAIEAKLKEKNT